MLKKWALSQFYRDEDDMLRPVATAYGMKWRVPMYPVDPEQGWALVEILTTATKMEAAVEDPRVIFFGGMYSPVPQEVVDAYAAHGATPGMTLGVLLDALAQVEPIFAEEMKV